MSAQDKIFKNRAQEYSYGKGTGNLELSGPFPKFRTFVDTFGSSNEHFDYLIETEEGDWEIGVGRYDASTNRLIRSTVAENHMGTKAKINVQGEMCRVSHIIAADSLNTILNRIT